MLEESSSPALDTKQTQVSSPKEENNSTNSEPATDTEDLEISDDDDDDRNHKHRRREARRQSFDDSTDEQSLARPYKKRNSVPDNGQFVYGTDSHGEVQKDYLSKFKRRLGAGPHNRVPRVNQSFRPDSVSRPDRSASAAARPPMARGRGRNTVPWTQHDPRFNPLDMIDFASQMASQGPPTHPSLFMGTALPSSASAQNGSWGPYGFIPGMANGILDPIHPLGLQGTIQPTISPLIDLGMPRQRCRDFEERGFCLRGDMCPMEHGVNRIVVEDMQSLSQFNLPVSVPNAQGLGFQNESGTAHVNASSLVGSKGVPTKDNKSGVTNDALKLNGVTVSAVAEADVYDPDQPLWNNERPEASCAGLRLPSPNNDDGVWNADSSAHEGAGREYANQAFAADASQNSKSSVWGRIASKRKSAAGKTANTNSTLTSTTGNQRSEDYEEMAPSTIQGKPSVTRDIAPKATNGQSNSRILGDVGRHGNRASHKASRTLYVNGIPQESNRWEALLSHFKKFGQVIDIYIPSNSEKAFVQFSKREEAEAALKAPDAVMGNRFIKLWWANRDRIPDERQSRVSTKSLQLPTTVASSVPSQPSPSNSGKENLQSTATKASTGSSAEASGSSTALKMLPPNGIKAVPPAPKKQESLELLEELRKKQEILAQKRDEFRRQLEKLAKQSSSATSVKQGEAGGKGYTANDVVKATGPRTINTSTEGTQGEVGCTLEKKISGDLVASSTPKSTATSTKKPAIATKQTAPLSAPLQNRFKLDNRTTSFRILPPLPAEIAEVSVLTDHFSSFGELSSVVLEDTEAHSHEATLTPSLSCSACVTYTTRQSAERAFVGGKSCKGHTLRFMWLTASPGSNSHSGPQITSISARASSFSSQTQEVAPESPSPVGKISSGAMSGTAANVDNESVPSVESTKTALAPISKTLGQASCSNSSISSNVDCPPVRDVTGNADSSNADFAQ